jgi:nucleotide-binding universal stress UspA family protein
MKKYKILVLSNLDSSTQPILKSAISMANMIDGEIEVFSVTKPTDVVNRDNQLSAIRTINNQHTATGKKMKNLIDPIVKDYNTKIKHSFVFGNVKNEIENIIKERKPDVIVLGKRKSTPLKLIGDNVTQFVFNSFKGTILIAADKTTLEPNKEISLGMLNNIEPLGNLKFAEDLMACNKSSLKSYKIVKNLDASAKMIKPNDAKTVEFVFEHNDGSIKNLSNYLSKNKVNLLYLNRMRKQTDDFMVSDIKRLVNNLNVNLLVTAEYKSHI